MHTSNIIKALKLISVVLLLIFNLSLDGFGFESKIGQFTQQKDSIIQQHPAIAGDFADPTILRVGKTYYAAGTSSEWAPYYPLYVSKNLTHWEQKGYLFKEMPKWAKSSFWAPELYYHNNNYLVYYVAKRKSDGVSCIGVGVSQNPIKGFKDKGVLLAFGKEAIDPFVFKDNGKLYLTWKAYGLDDRPIELLCAELSDDGLKLVGKPFTLMRDDQKIGLEGQSIVKHNKFYYLFYSTGNCCGRDCSYDIRIARATSLRGKFEKLETPLLQESENWKCTGHGTLVETPDNRSFFMYHAYNKKDNVYTGRQGMLTELFWDDTNGWPYFKMNTLALPHEGKNFTDGFAGKKTNDKWQWDLKFPKPQLSQKQSKLYLSEVSEIENPIGAALTIRPEKGNYTISATVENTNDALKGLVIYGDSENSIGLGVKKDKLEVWEIKAGVRSILSTQTIKNQAIKLSIKVEDGYLCQFYSAPKTDNLEEIVLKQKETVFNASFLPPWDRSIRPGIMQKGKTDQPAVFASFTINY
ncbi:beta-xylosidase [Pedobacter sp. UYEF25]